MPSVLVIYQAGLHASKHNQAIEILSSLHIQISTCSITSNATEQPLEPELEALLARTDHIIITGVSLALLKQLDELDDSNPLAALVLYGLSIGMSVSAIHEAIDPRAYLATKGTPSFKISKRIDQRLHAIQALGIDILPLCDLKQRIASPLKDQQNIITLKDVQTASMRGIYIEQLKGHLTPAAQDWLHEQHQLRQSLRSTS